MKKIYSYESPLFFYTLQETDGALTRLWLGDQLTLIPKDVEVCETPLLKEAKGQLDAYFAGKLQEFSLPLAPEGTAFQLKVWEALRSIPYGATITYGQLAERVGDRKAARAVGMANSRNPLPVIIPCHRVVRSGGKVGGYTGGIAIKIKLLLLEDAQLL